MTATVADVEHRYDSVLFSYFPSRVPLHPGDAINFEVRDTGEPHTAALGKLVDAAVNAIGALGSVDDLRKVEALPEMRRLPTVFPNVPGGRPRANRSASDRCILERGRPRVSERGGAPACEERVQPDFDGTQAFFSSGYLEEGEPFRVRLASDIRPGSYSFMCLVHRSQMFGAIEVRPPGVERPRVADVRKQASEEEDAVVSTLEQAARRAAARKEPDAVLAGTGPVGTLRGMISSFIPNEFVTRPGGTVSWQLFGTHSISFEPSRDAEEGILVEDREGVDINVDAWRTVGGPSPPAAAVSYLSAEPKLVVRGGTWSGEGTLSSGVLRSTPPASVVYELTFAKAGIYRYRCLVHSRMRGVVRVQDAP